MIDKRAIISDDAQIGNNVTIGANAIIGENVKIADNVIIMPNAYLEHCEIGEGTSIAPFASIGTAPQDLGYKNEPTKSIIGKNCIIKEYATVNRGATEGSATIVGNNCLLMTSSHVAHNCVLEDGVIMANLATLGGHCHVGYGAWLGGMSVFHQNIRIGSMAIVSGFSASRQDILPFTKCDGRPAVPKGLNIIAMKRRGVPLEVRTATNRAFKLLMSPEYNTTQAIAKIREELEMNEYIEKMIEFVETSKRGVVLKSHKKDALEGGMDD